MFYIFINGNQAVESIPEFDPVFPGVQVTERYAADFLSKCVTSPTAIPDGWTYDPTTGEFSEPPAPEPLTDMPRVLDEPLLPNYTAFVAGLMEGYADGQ